MTIILLVLLITINANNLIRLPVLGSFYSAYTTTVMFGSERIPMKMLLDTGSSLSVLQCINC